MPTGLEGRGLHSERGLGRRGQCRGIIPALQLLDLGLQLAAGQSWKDPLHHVGECWSQRSSAEKQGRLCSPSSQRPDKLNRAPLRCSQLHAVHAWIGRKGGPAGHIPLLEGRWPSHGGGVQASHSPSLAPAREAASQTHGFFRCCSGNRAGRGALRRGNQPTRVAVAVASQREARIFKKRHHLLPP